MTNKPELTEEDIVVTKMLLSALKDRDRRLLLRIGNKPKRPVADYLVIKIELYGTSDSTKPLKL